MAQLILIRHGQSTWNAANRFTGWVDVPLSHQGRAEAMEAAHRLSSYKIDVCFTSLLVRAIETAVICLTERPLLDLKRSPVIIHNHDDPEWQGWNQYKGEADEEIPIFLSKALDERYYGKLQGLNKVQVAEEFGFETVQQWRRSFSARPPGGESLEDTAARTLPYFQSRILSHLKQGDTVLVSAHGNSLRSIVMFLDRLSQIDVYQLEIATGIPIVYTVNALGEPVEKVTLNEAVPA